MKQELINQITALLDAKIQVLKTEIEQAKESRNDDTKSSAGDKYETAREMIQQEIDKTENQLQLNLNLKNELSKIDLNKKHEQITFGSLVKTNEGNYFISIAMGKIRIQHNDYFCISLASPIGKAFFNKKEKETFTFMNKQHIIQSIS